ncbi:MAG: hypothetical protein M3342_06755, partial [Bacteroidota bacterium]|nr:hypothetical protein [Bacteroidota bacterium]
MNVFLLKQLIHRRPFQGGISTHITYHRLHWWLLTGDHFVVILFIQMDNRWTSAIPGCKTKRTVL